MRTPYFALSRIVIDFADSRVEVAHLENERRALSRELYHVQSDLALQVRPQLAEDEKYLISLRKELAELLTDHGKLAGKPADSQTKLDKEKREQALLSQALTNAHIEFSSLNSGTC
jgi:hypothetical protein